MRNINKLIMLSSNFDAPFQWTYERMPSYVWKLGIFMLLQFRHYAGPSPVSWHSGKYLVSPGILQPCITTSYTPWLWHMLYSCVRLCIHVQKVPLKQASPVPHLPPLHHFPYNLKIIFKSIVLNLNVNVPI